MDKQLTKIFVAGVAAIALIVGAFGAVGSLGADEHSSGNPGRGIVGAWEVSVGGAFLNNVVLADDGTVINSGPFAKAGIGVWEKTGARSYTIHIVHPIDDHGREDSSNLVYDIIVDLDLSKDGQEASGTYETRVRTVLLSDDDVVYEDTGETYEGTVEYDRIGIDRD